MYIYDYIFILLQFIGLCDYSISGCIPTDASGQNVDRQLVLLNLNKTNPTLTGRRRRES